MMSRCETGQRRGDQSTLDRESEFRLRPIKESLGINGIKRGPSVLKHSTRIERYEVDWDQISQNPDGQ